MGELTAAGITDPAMRAAYRSCRAINAAHGRSYFLATRLLPAARRPAVHALYGFARLADEIVDSARPRPVEERASMLDRLAAELHGTLAGEPASPALTALADTVRRHDIAPELFDAFLASMRMDLTVRSYATFADLGGYMHGSAGVIGLQMLPVLGTVCPREEAEAPAMALGEAFQLTNFLRDVGEDLDRGRVYLPADELAVFGVDTDRLRRARRTGRPDPAIRRALTHLVAHTYAVYRRAEPGISLLHKESRPCMRTAATLYRGILDEIVAADYAVLDRRVVVSRARRAAVAARGLIAGTKERRWSG
ncbi:phytoene synthase [Herbihabitans rhizosphaerae]|uniref:Phytoene synthase n=1 Tax=Herbihabitans rhizosphaerae TaxID=1872711 RepID=A0A4Q7KT34_9PSEU|nr:phytoene/squalene synthase family protein [Herbihabitans rhizosphaerae]RZS38951.1 phytoene synthase [Herbihabitans rhizosphaerae]